MTESSESITSPDFLSFSEILFYWLRSVIMLRICSHFFSIAPGFVANITVKNMLINRETELKTYFRLLQCRIDKFLAVIRFKIFFCFLVFKNRYQHLNQLFKIHHTFFSLFETRDSIWFESKGFCFRFLALKVIPNEAILELI